MIRNYHRWRYARRERRPSFSFHNREHEQFGPAFGHYLSLRGSHQIADDPYDKRRRRRKYWKATVVVLLLLGAGWLVHELLYAIRFF